MRPWDDEDLKRLHLEHVRDELDLDANSDFDGGRGGELRLAAGFVFNEGAITEADVLEAPEAPPGLESLSAPSADLTDDPDPRGPCGAPVDPLPLLDGAIAFFGQDDIVIVNVVLADTGGLAERLAPAFESAGARYRGVMRKHDFEDEQFDSYLLFRNRDINIHQMKAIHQLFRLMELFIVIFDYSFFNRNFL